MPAGAPVPRVSRLRSSSRAQATIAHLSAGGIGRRDPDIRFRSVRDGVKDLPVRALQNRVPVETGGGDELVPEAREDRPRPPAMAAAIGSLFHRGEDLAQWLGLRGA